MRYKNDPRWLIARFASTCSCGKRISKGDDIFYYPIGRKAVCQDCGQKGAAELASDDFDEMVYHGGQGY